MMTDNQVFAIIFAIVRDGCNDRGLDVYVQQSFQPTQQGVPTKPILAIHRIDSKRYGWPENESYFDENNDVVVQRQSYWLESTYQLDCLAIQNPQTPQEFTAFDFVDAAAMILQTSKAVDAFRAAGIGILRIEPLRVQYFIDDKGRHEQVPSFDFTLTYRQVLLDEANPVVRITGEIQEV